MRQFKIFLLNILIAATLPPIIISIIPGSIIVSLMEICGERSERYLRWLAIPAAPIFLLGLCFLFVGECADKGIEILEGRSRHLPPRKIWPLESDYFPSTWGK